jgi:hypothetical protein
MAPVLTLTLIARGAFLGGMSLLIGTYSFTVIAMEFPSACTPTFADESGRF